MTTPTDIRLQFNINPQARAIQSALEHYADNDALAGLCIEAWPHFNGRERGVCLAVSICWGTRRLLVSFAENRNTDEIFVQHARTERTMINGPKLSDFNDLSYRTRAYFGCLHVHEAVSHILEIIAEWKDETEPA